MAAGRVGAHLLVVDGESFEPLFGPAVVSVPDDRDISTDTIRAVVAPHDAGFAVVWNGWSELANYGIYGAVVRCD